MLGLETASSCQNVNREGCTSSPIHLTVVKKNCSLSNSVFFFLKPCQDVFGRTQLVLVSAFKLRGLQKRPDVSACPVTDFLYPQSMFVFRLPPSVFPRDVNALAGSLT